MHPVTCPVPSKQALALEAGAQWIREPVLLSVLLLRRLLQSQGSILSQQRQRQLGLAVVPRGGLRARVVSRRDRLHAVRARP